MIGKAFYLETKINTCNAQKLGERVQIVEGESDKTISGFKAFKTNGKRWIIEINMQNLTELAIFHFLISTHDN